MNRSKRNFLQALAVPALSVALSACGGSDDAAATPAGGAAGAGGATGSLTITGNSNLPDAATQIIPDAGLPPGPSASNASTFNNLLDAAVNSLVNGAARFLSVPLAGTAPPALGSTYTVVADTGAGGGAVVTLLVTVIATSQSYYFSPESGTVKITAISATSADLLFTNVTLFADPRAMNNRATGKVILNGTVTIHRV